MKDTRELKTFERTLGNYEVAGAIYSYGDAIAFADNGWVVIADTVGHYEGHGKQMEEFLNKQITEGWGSGDIKEEVADLGRRLLIAGTGKPELPEEINYDNKWWDSPEFCYAHLSNKEVYLGGLNFTLVRKEGSMEEVPYESPEGIKMLAPMHFENIENRAPYKTILEVGDVLLMGSDGLVWNVGITSSQVFGVQLNKKLINDYLGEILIDNRNKSPKKIREALFHNLQEYFTPCLTNEEPPEWYDDVTFAIIKRT